VIQRAVTTGENDEVDTVGMRANDIGEVEWSALRQGDRLDAGTTQMIEGGAERLSAFARASVRQNEGAGLRQDNPVPLALALATDAASFLSFSRRRNYERRGADMWQPSGLKHLES
jgi:hypothetical protein